MTCFLADVSQFQRSTQIDNVGAEEFQQSSGASVDVAIDNLRVVILKRVSVFWGVYHPC